MRVQAGQCSLSGGIGVHEGEGVLPKARAYDSPHEKLQQLVALGVGCVEAIRLGRFLQIVNTGVERVNLQLAPKGLLVSDAFADMT